MLARMLQRILSLGGRFFEKQLSIVLQDRGQLSTFAEKCS